MSDVAADSGASKQMDNFVRGKIKGGGCPHYNELRYIFKVCRARRLEDDPIWLNANNIPDMDSDIEWTKGDELALDRDDGYLIDEPDEVEVDQPLEDDPNEVEIDQPTSREGDQSAPATTEDQFGIEIKVVNKIVRSSMHVTSGSYPSVTLTYGGRNSRASPDHDVE